MKFYSFLSLAAGVLASPTRSPQTQPFVPRLPGDLRSPCPGLNALANHNYIPHNGRAISGPMMVAAFKKAMNFDTNLTEAVVATNFAGINTDPSVPVNLDIFFMPNKTDFRCSVARDDYKKPIDLARITYALAQNSMSYVTPETWGKARLAVEALTTDATPGNNDIGAGAGTGALMFMSTTEDSHANGNYSNIHSRKDWVFAFMGEERFPVELGWKPQAVPLNLVDLGGISAEIATARIAALGH